MTAISKFSAIAFTIFLLAFPLGAIATHGSFSARITDPAEGGELELHGNVTLSVNASSGATTVAGYLTLDGERVATFARPYSQVVVVTVNATSLGSARLGGEVWTDRDAAIALPAVNVTVVVDNAPPSLRVSSATYDRSTRSLVVTGNASDPDDGLAYVTVTTGNRTTQHGVDTSGSFNASHAYDGPSGWRNTTIRAVDTHGKSTGWFTYFYVPPNAFPYLATHNVTYDAENAQLVVTGNASDTDGTVVDISVTVKSTTTHHTLGADGSFHAVHPFSGPPGGYYAWVSAIDDQGASTTRVVTFNVPNDPPTINVTSARHVIGMGFRFSGTAADDENVTIHVSTIYGARSTIPGPDGTWNLDIPAFPQLGIHNVTIVASDGDPYTTAFANVTINVVGEPRVVYEKRVEPGLGAFASVEQFSLVPRIRAGQLDFCTEAGCNVTAPGKTGVAIVRENGTIRATCVETWPACRFDAEAAADVKALWLGAPGAYTLRVVGTLV